MMNPLRKADLRSTFDTVFSSMRVKPFKYACHIQFQNHIFFWFNLPKIYITFRSLC